MATFKDKILRPKPKEPVFVKKLAPNNLDSQSKQIADEKLRYQNEREALLRAQIQEDLRKESTGSKTMAQSNSKTRKLSSIEEQNRL